LKLIANSAIKDFQSLELVAKDFQISSP
jgi:hypothetical protein